MKTILRAFILTVAIYLITAMLNVIICVIAKVPFDISVFAMSFAVMCLFVTIYGLLSLKSSIKRIGKKDSREDDYPWDDKIDYES